MKDKINYKEKVKKLEAKVRELEEVLAIALNKKLLRELAEEIKRVQRGEYYTETEFIKRHHLVPA